MSFVKPVAKFALSPVGALMSGAKVPKSLMFGAAGALLDKNKKKPATPSLIGRSTTASGNMPAPSTIYR